MPSTSALNALIAAIPVAQDGDVITREYHNSLRAALVALATRIGAGIGEQTMTLAPAFLTNGSQPGWSLEQGQARMPAVGASGRASAQGWLAVTLPEGARITSMTVLGRRGGNAPTGPINAFSFAARLLRYALDDPDQNPTTLINIPLTNERDPFVAKRDLQVVGAPPSALEEYRLVRNNRYKYIVVVELSNGNADTIASVSGIQITYGGE